MRIVLLAGAALFTTSLVAAQEIGWLDLTDMHPRDRIRAPHTVGSSCGGVAGFTPDTEVSIALVSLDKASYSLGEEVTYEVKIQNSGKKPVEIPWTPHLGELEPTDPSQSYTFLQAAVSLTFTEPESKRSFSVYADAYGSSDVPGSTRRLLPGEWVFVRARKKVEVYEEWWWTKIKDSPPLNVGASASLMLNKVTYSPAEKGDSGRDQSVCIPLGTKLGAPVDVVLWSKTSN